MNFLILDTETTGLPLKGAQLYSEQDWGKFEHWPRMVEIALHIEAIQPGVDVSLPVYSQDTLIRPVGFEIPKQVTDDVHGITTKMALEEGVDIKVALLELMRVARHVDAIVCHNVHFDCNIIFSELHRANLFTELNRFLIIPKICTLETARGLHGYGGNSLSVLYSRIFGGVHVGHRAKEDVEATLQIFKHFFKQGHFNHLIK